jgi:hypothetical protein
LARKCHRCHRNEKEARLVGNRRASARLSPDLNFSRVASSICGCFSLSFTALSIDKVIKQPTVIKSLKFETSVFSNTLRTLEEKEARSRTI